MALHPVTIYTITYNEELMLPHFIAHYRTAFPGCHIVVFDNESTDATPTIARLHGCQVITYTTGNQLSDTKYLDIKNHCWQQPGNQPRWVFIVDCDELCQIDHTQLRAEQLAGTTLIRFQGLNMVNMADNLNIPAINHAVPDDMYSKNYCFLAGEITAINYNHGCHKSNPKGRRQESKTVYNCYHYRFINPGYLVQRYQRNHQRLSPENRAKGMGSHYTQPAAQIHQQFAQARTQAIPVPAPDFAGTTPQLTIHVCGYQQNHQKHVPQLPHLHPVNLSTLPLPHGLQNNLLSEHRLLLHHATTLSPISHSSHYTGIATWRWAQKCKHLLPLHQLQYLPLQPNVVWAAWTDPEWYTHSIVTHKGIQPYLEELCDLTGLPPQGPDGTGIGLYGNQFICSHDVYLSFLQHFKKVFLHFHTKYGFTGFRFWVKESDKPRLPAVFYERVAAHYFANRTGLIIKQIPKQ